MISNYKPTVDVRLKRGGRREKFQSHLKSWSRQNCQPCWNLFYAEGRKVSGRKTIQSQHCESQFVPVWTDFFFWFPSGKESRFPLFGISIQAGKRSSRSITERSCATGIDFFYKAQASNFQRRPWSPAANQLGMNVPESFSNLACFNTILYFGKRGRENQREMKPGDL